MYGNRDSVYDKKQGNKLPIMWSLIKLSEP